VAAAIRQRSWTALGLVLTGGVIPLVLVQALSYASPLYVQRYALIWLPAWCVALAFGLARGGWPVVVAGGVLLAGQLVSLSQVYFPGQLFRDDYRGVIATITAEWRPGDVLLLDHARIYPVYAWYAAAPPAWRGRLDAPDLPRGGGPNVVQIGRIVQGVPNPAYQSNELAEVNATVATERLAQLAEDYDRIWLLRAYPTSRLPLDWLEAHAGAERAIWVPGGNLVQLYLFRTRGRVPALPQEATPRTDVFANGLRLAGWQLPDGDGLAGQPVRVRLFWLAEAGPPAPSPVVFVRLIDYQGRALAQTDAPPAGGAYALERGSYLVDDQAIRLPPALPTGAYRLEVGLHPSDSGVPIPTAAGASTVTLGRLRVRGDQPAASPALAQFGSAIALVGVERAAAGRAGADYTVRLTWQAMQTVTHPYHVFLHLYDAAGRLVAQEDGPPAQGDAPTDFWQAGDVILDPHVLRLPGPGTYRLVVGLYAADGTRLPVAGGDSYTLGMLEVRP
jgi:hypothetical protein